MNEFFIPSHWAKVWVQNGLVLWVQTTLLLGLGLLALRFLQKGQPSARDVLGRALLVSTLAGVALSLGLSLSGWSPPPALWNVSLSARPVSLTDTSAAVFPNSPPAQFSSPEPRPRILANNPATKAAAEKAGDKPSASSPARAESVAATGGELTARSAPRASQRVATPEVNGWRSLLSLLVGLWFGGAMGLILWWGLCHEALLRLRRGAHPEEDAAILATLSEVCAPARVRVPLLLRHSKVSSPFLTGLFRPAILLPASDAELDPAMLRAIFSHEAMHLKRRDIWWIALGRVGCALLWPQPLLWMLCRQIEQSSEEACDQAVLEAGCPRHEYAKCLLDFADHLTPRRAQRIAGIGVLTGKSSLSHRIQTILSTSQTKARQISKRGRWLIIASTVVCILGMPFLVSGGVAPQDPASGATKSVASQPQVLQRYQTVGDYGVGISGVENGVLQGILIREQRDGMLRHMIRARTARRQTNSTRWSLNDGITYGFSDEKGLVSKSSFKSLVLSDPALCAYLSEQSQAASQPLSAAEKKQLRSDLPTRELGRLEAWAMKQRRVAISGRVVDEDQRPVAGAKVVAQMDYKTEQRILGEPSSGSSTMMYSFALPKVARNVSSQVVTTAADGTYRMDGLAPVRYELRTAEFMGVPRIEGKVRAEAAKPPAQVLKAIVRVLPRVGQVTLAPDLELTSGGLLRVRVLDKISGAALPGVMLFGSIKGRLGLNVPTSVVETDAKGEALFRLPAGRVNVGLGGQRVPDSRNFAANSNGTYYAVDRGNKLSLDGAPAQRIGGSTSLDILPNRTHEAVLRLARFVAPTPKPVPTAAPRMPPPKGTASLVGRVVDETGRPVPGITVRALIQRQAQWKLMQGAGLANSNESTPNFKQKWASIDPVLFERTRTRADGSFRLEGLTTAPYNLVVGVWHRSSERKPPPQRVAAAIEGVWAKEGQVVRRTQPIVLTSGALIEGYVVDKATGKPLGGVIIGANGPQLPTTTDNTISATSDAQGRFRFRVAPGTSLLYVQGPWNNDTNFVFADDGKSAANVARIRTNRGLYAGSGKVQFEINGGAPRFGLNFSLSSNKSDWQIKVPVQSGQKSQITLHLRRLVPKKPDADS